MSALILPLLLALVPAVVSQHVGELSSPPLQYLSLSGLLGGDSPPGLKDAALGYDETSRSIIIFGGESNGIPQSQTYLLNLDSLTWTVPSPPANLNEAPPPRSAAISASDFAASNRHSFVIIGGKGDNDTPLSDVWEYDWNNQFWAQVQVSPGAPPARWHAMGGKDIRTGSHTDPSIPGPNNTLYFSGGTDGSQVFTDGLWTLELAGTLSSNLPNSAVGSWTHTPLDDFPSLSSSAGTVLSSKVVATGSCDESDTDSCPLQSFSIIDAETQSLATYDACPAPRIGPVLVPNLNEASTSFNSEAFMLFGLYSTSVWNDTQGLEHGEVDILDVNIGSWVRVIPAGDPIGDGEMQYPAPRQGAAALAYGTGLVGASRESYNDIFIFGGQDQAGNYLNDVWLLRAYNDRLTPSNATVNAGSLSTGINADGSGVAVAFLALCPSQFPSSSPTSSSSSPSSSSPSSPSDTPSPTATNSTTDALYDVPTVHKVLSSVSVAVLLFSLLGQRASPAPQQMSLSSNQRSHQWSFLWYVLAAMGWGLGIAGFASAVAGISLETESTVTKRDDQSSSTPQFLQTRHGQAGFALFVAFYVVVPVLVFIEICKSRQRNSTPLATQDSSGGGVSAEKSPLSDSPPSDASASPRTRPLPVQRLSEDSESTSSAGPVRGFEVLNRHRTRPSSSHNATLSSASRQLGEVDWLQRRRSLNTVGELDYAITQVLRSHHPPTPAQERLLSNGKLEASRLTFPPPSTIFLHLLLHTIILGLCLLTLIALWLRAPIYAFALFLTWTISFYIIIFILSWRHWRPTSVLSVLISRLRTHALHPISSSEQPSQDKVPNSSPYLHAPNVGDPINLSPIGRSVEDDDDEDGDVDEYTHQRRIEEEMDRRQVSIVTVPKKKLRVTNPEPPS